MTDEGFTTITDGHSRDSRPGVDGLPKAWMLGCVIVADWRAGFAEAERPPRFLGRLVEWVDGDDLDVRQPCKLDQVFSDTSARARKISVAAGLCAVQRSQLLLFGQVAVCDFGSVKCDDRLASHKQPDFNITGMEGLALEPVGHRPISFPCAARRHKLIDEDEH